MYTLRYTGDLEMVRISDDLDSLKAQGAQSDYKVHVVLTETGKLVWQSSPSMRYGDRLVG